jgi:hypothetical protein
VGEVRFAVEGASGEEGPLDGGFVMADYVVGKVLGDIAKGVEEA